MAYVRFVPQLGHFAVPEATSVPHFGHLTIAPWDGGGACPWDPPTMVWLTLTLTGAGAAAGAACSFLPCQNDAMSAMIEAAQMM